MESGVLTDTVCHMGWGLMHCISHPALKLSDKLNILKLESDPPSHVARKLTQNTRPPFSNVRWSEQETDRHQKGREEKQELGGERESRRREMEGGKIKQREMKRIEGGGIHLLHTYCSHHGPTYIPFCLLNHSFPSFCRVSMRESAETVVAGS